MEAYSTWSGDVLLGRPKGGTLAYTATSSSFQGARLITLEYTASAWQESSFRDRTQQSQVAGHQRLSGTKPALGLPTGQQLGHRCLVEQALDTSPPRFAKAFLSGVFSAPPPPPPGWGLARREHGGGWELPLPRICGGTWSGASAVS